MLFEHIEADRLHLMALRLLAPHLTEENHAELSEAAAGPNPTQPRDRLEPLSLARCEVQVTVRELAEPVAERVAWAMPRRKLLVSDRRGSVSVREALTTPDFSNTR